MPELKPIDWIDAADRGERGALERLKDWVEPEDRDALLAPFFRDLEATQPGGAPKYREYSLPGGKKYRELLFTLPVPRYESRLFSLEACWTGIL